MEWMGNQTEGCKGKYLKILAFFVISTNFEDYAKFQITTLVTASSLAERISPT